MPTCYLKFLTNHWKQNFKGKALSHSIGGAWVCLRGLEWKPFPRAGSFLREVCDCCEYFCVLNEVGHKIRVNQKVLDPCFTVEIHNHPVEREGASEPVGPRPRAPNSEGPGCLGNSGVACPGTTLRITDWEFQTGLKKIKSSRKSSRNQCEEARGITG